jgi:hypothetical protein
LNNFHRTIKVKVKLSLCLTKRHTMKVHWGSGGVTPLILDFGTRRRWVVRFTPPVALHPRKSPWYPLDRRLGGPQSQSGRGGEEKNSQPLPGLKPPIIQSVAQRCITELSRPRYVYREVIALCGRNIIFSHLNHLSISPWCYTVPWVLARIETRLRAGRSWFNSRQENSRTSSFHYRVRTGCGAHAASCPMGPRGLLSRE